MNTREAQCKPDTRRGVLSFRLLRALCTLRDAPRARAEEAVRIQICLGLAPPPHALLPPHTHVCILNSVIFAVEGSELNEEWKYRKGVHGGWLPGRERPHAPHHVPMSWGRTHAQSKQKAKRSTTTGGTRTTENQRPKGSQGGRCSQVDKCLLLCMVCV